MLGFVVVQLTHKLWETHGGILSIVATDALVLKHKAISMHSPDLIFLLLGQFHTKLDMSTARQRLKSPQSLSGTSTHPTMVTLVNIMVKNEWLTSFSFHVNRLSHSWDKAISDSYLEISTPRSRSWVWSKGRSYNWPSIISTHFVFISHQSDH